MGKLGRFNNLNIFLEDILANTYYKEDYDYSGQLDTTDIYNFYLASFLFQSMEDADKPSIDPIIKEIKMVYLRAFEPVVKRQLIKYLNRGRYNGELDSDSIHAAKTFGELDEYMNQTFRSDMKRRNKEWNKVTDFLSQIEKEKRTDKLIYLIDRLNNTIHNTQESILTKFDNGYELVDAFDKAHLSSVKELRNLADNTSLKRALVNYRYLMDEGGGWTTKDYRPINPDSLMRRPPVGDEKPSPGYSYFKNRKMKESVLVFESEYGEQKLSVFDLDDTLISSDNKVYVIKDNKVVRELNSSEFALDIKKDDEVYDFSDFANVTDPEILDTQFNKFKEYINDKDVEVAILTARDNNAKDAIIKTLKEQGIDPSTLHIECVGSSDPNDKQRWIEQKYESGDYGKIEFYDDSEKNIMTVKKWLDDIGIEYKLVNVGELNNKVYINKGRLSAKIK